MRIDHVLYAVSDLDDAAARWAADFGLRSVAGGVHPRWGTANRIVPLGGAYLELIGIVDPDVAARTVLGCALARFVAGGGGWFSLCLGDVDIQTTAARLGLAVEEGSRTRPDGTVVAWRAAGIDDPDRTLDLPFFISWNVPPPLHPGAPGTVQDGSTPEIAAVEIAGDALALHKWIGPAMDRLPIRVVSGVPGIRAVELSAPGATIRID
jgi:catechol 2,3-dioxygenase-like lactoylglutathione lyase family enzyme